MVSSFFQKNKKEICSYYFSNDSHVQAFIHHLYSKSLVDPLKSFLVLLPDDHYSHHDDSDAINQQKLNPFSRFYKQRIEGLNSLFAVIGQSDDSDIVQNAQYIIETLIAKIDQTVDGGKILDDVVLKKENIEILFNCLKCVYFELHRTTSIEEELPLIF